MKQFCLVCLVIALHSTSAQAQIVPSAQDTTKYTATPINQEFVIDSVSVMLRFDIDARGIADVIHIEEFKCNHCTKRERKHYKLEALKIGKAATRNAWRNLTGPEKPIATEILLPIKFYITAVTDLQQEN
jgi:hypothetical protein